LRTRNVCAMQETTSGDRSRVVLTLSPSRLLPMMIEGIKRCAHRVHGGCYALFLKQLFTRAHAHFCDELFTCWQHLGRSTSLQTKEQATTTRSLKQSNVIKRHRISTAVAKGGGRYARIERVLCVRAPL
jgi:hypothetical protein